VTHCSEIDALVQRWVTTQSVNDCVQCLCAINIPCGPIATVAQLAGEPNLRHRRMIHHLVDPVTNRELVLPGTPYKASRTAARIAKIIPLPGADQDHIATQWQSPTAESVSARSPLPRPLAGIRVIEIGQYTTAPLVARQLGALGAEVLKIEPRAGDGSRTWPPLQGDQGYLFTFSNSDKRSLMLDLRSALDKTTFSELLKTADVLVENLKPGSLARLGYGPEALASRYPRLVYCGVSGFGADSAYPERPAFDTVVQAMSGIMDLTRVNGTPGKAGISRPMLSAENTVCSRFWRRSNFAITPVMASILIFQCRTLHVG
jgi:crotonobetainyl-CoA:carnitine CoA-transferase CaiB-like acyl-CoA transferase